jgi:hypothetical protein
MTDAGTSTHGEIPGTVTDPARTAFFHDLSRWREQLARSIARNNLELRSEGIATVTNRILFSLLFLRIAEDRGLMADGDLQEICDHPDPYGQLLEVSAPLSPLWGDEDESSRHLPVPMGTIVIEDRVVHAVISCIVSPDRPYRFDTMKTETIADVFYQYLSGTVRRSAAHHAAIVETHDTVLSRGAVTPPLPVLRYLAVHTLQAACRARSHHELLPVRILDPACGAGTTLICACRSLFDGAGSGRLNYEERHAILTASIHGVDISPHAVAATKMLLFFLLCEEDAGRSAPARDFLDRAGSVLRDLRHTIRCGNALIDPEIVHDESWAFCPARERHTLGAFSWRSGFPEIFSSGGFDAVVGNPPEGLPEQKEWIQQYLQRHYTVFEPGAERSFFFIERSLSLLRPGGTLGVCTNDRWLRGRAASPLRALLSRQQVSEIVDLPGMEKDHGGPGICVLRLSKQLPADPVRVTIVDPAFSGSLDGYVKTRSFPVDPGTLGEGGWALKDTRHGAILRKVQGVGTSLEDYVMGQTFPGRDNAMDPVFLVDARARKALIGKDPRSKALIRPVVACTEVGRYEPALFASYIVFIPRGWTMSHPAAAANPWRWFRSRHPALARLLREHAGSGAGQGSEGVLWWETPAGDETFRERTPRIIFRERFETPAFVYDDGRAIPGPGTMAIPTSGPYLAGLLNSRLIAFVFAKTPGMSGCSPAGYSWDDLRVLPVYTPDFDDPADASRHNRIVSLVTRLLDLKKHLSGAGSDQERRSLQEKIKATDRKIDRVVYELYGLNPEEIAVVEPPTPEDLFPDPL